MTRREEIKAKADELGQFYFPNECNVWARDNIEAKFVSSACIEMAKWMQETMIEKVRQWFNLHFRQVGTPKEIRHDFESKEKMWKSFTQFMEE